MSTLVRSSMYIKQFKTRFPKTVTSSQIVNPHEMLHSRHLTASHSRVCTVFCLKASIAPNFHNMNDCQKKHPAERREDWTLSLIFYFVEKVHWSLKLSSTITWLLSIRCTSFDNNCLFPKDVSCSEYTQFANV